MIGGNPWFNTVLSLAAIKAWLQAQALTLTQTLTITKTAQSTTAESPILSAGVSDNALSYMQIQNGSATDGVFVPRLVGSTNTGSANALQFVGLATTDSGTSGVLHFDGRVNGAAAATRPPFTFATNSTRLGTWWPSGLMIGSDTSTAAAAKMEVQDASSQIAFGTAVDQAFLLGTSAALWATWGAKWNGGAWIARQTSAAILEAGTGGFKFNFDSGLTVGNSFTRTEIGRLNATGLGVGATPGCKLDVAGTIRSTTNTNPSSGKGIELRYNTGTDVGTTQVYDWGTSAYKTLNLDAFEIFLKTGTSAVSNRVKIGQGAVTFYVPPILPTYTPGTLPSVASFQHAIVRCTGTARGDRNVVSNGTNWVYCEDESVTVS